MKIIKYAIMSHFNTISLVLQNYILDVVYDKNEWMTSIEWHTVYFLIEFSVTTSGIVSKKSETHRYCHEQS